MISHDLEMVQASCLLNLKNEIRTRGYSNPSGTIRHYMAIVLFETDSIGLDYPNLERSYKNHLDYQEYDHLQFPEISLYYLVTSQCLTDNFSLWPLLAKQSWSGLHPERHRDHLQAARARMSAERLRHPASTALSYSHSQWRSFSHLPTRPGSPIHPSASGAGSTRCRS